jgi:hypothetical protein
MNLHKRKSTTLYGGSLGHNHPPVSSNGFMGQFRDYREGDARRAGDNGYVNHSV